MVTLRERVDVAFLVQLDEREVRDGRAHVYDAQIRRLYPPYPVDDLLAAGECELPSRLVTELELASAERLDGVYVDALSQIVADAER